MMYEICRRQCSGLLVVRPLVYWLGLLGWLVTFPAVIAAHTALVWTAPAAGAVVAQPPHEVRFWFNEPIERNFSRIEVFHVVS
jgi:methionine-rich copper-binding protein CopC